MRVLSLVLVLLMTPAIHGVQVVAHLLADGHLAHREDVKADGDCDDCTPLAHQCRCHAPMSVTPAARAEARTVPERAEPSPAPRPAPARPGRSSEPPPLRPPIA